LVDKLIKYQQKPIRGMKRASEDTEQIPKKQKVNESMASPQTPSRPRPIITEVTPTSYGQNGPLSLETAMPTIMGQVGEEEEVGKYSRNESSSKRGHVASSAIPLFHSGAQSTPSHQANVPQTPPSSSTQRRRYLKAPRTITSPLPKFDLEEDYEVSSMEATE